MKRVRDGFVEEYGTGPDLNSYGDENYSLTLEFTPSENLNILIRADHAASQRQH